MPIVTTVEVVIGITEIASGLTTIETTIITVDMTEIIKQIARIFLVRNIENNSFYKKYFFIRILSIYTLKYVKIHILK